MSIEINRNVLIVGGGISGLTAQFELEKMGLSSLLIESENEIGGKIKTVKKSLPKGDLVVELGPDSFVPNKDTFELLESLNLKSDLIKSNKLKTGILNEGKIKDLPNGFYFMLPTAAIPFLTTSLVSWRGKLRAGLELFQEKRRDNTDESIAQFVRRRFGDEMLQRLVKPLVKGIFGADGECQSVNATLPQFPAMEKKYGSLLRGMLRSQKRSSPGFLSFKEGMNQVTKSLYQRNRDNILLGTSLINLTRDSLGGFKAKLTNNQSLKVNNVIFATPPRITAKYLDGLSSEASDLLSSFKQKKTRLFYYAYPIRGKIPDHTGLLFDRDLGINSLSFSSLKFQKRAPEDMLLVRASCSAEGSEMQIEELIRKLSGVSMGAIWNDKSESTMPLYEVGHRDRIKRLYSLLPQDIFLCGNAYEGASVPDCISLARRVVGSIMQDLK